ncbi:MAG: acetylxylan esterase [Dysgonamonadaceae bacterium]|jgi:cephalosporin-C deacetylase|nr:acetylxylan esterase [Dysgonamonadaceae bacterium]
MKKTILICFLGTLSVIVQANNFPELSCRIPGNWVFYGDEKGTVSVVLKNRTNQPVASQIHLDVTSDDYQPVYSFSQQTKINTNDTVQATFTFNFPVPGFYRCRIYQEANGQKSEEKKFNIGYEPEKIISPKDAKPDFQSFWDDTRRELDRVKPEYQLTELKKSSSKTRKVYQVKMKSFGGETIEGYYVVPVKKGKYPVIVSYMGYGSKPWIPNPDNNPGFAEFVLSTRGQGLLEPENKYGQWITYGLESKETYYYRGAFMDLIRAIDFVASRPEVDSEKIVAEGGSQGGAFTLAACALDRRIKAAAPFIPFLSDYKDYFKIVHWPRVDFENYRKENPSAAWEQIYDVLSYFDIKNLASQIQCPIIMAVGLQDEVCPPHTNFAGYNQIKTEKQYYIFPEQGHDVPASWWEIRTTFYQKILEQ